MKSKAVRKKQRFYSVTKSNKDLFFVASVSVFAAVTIFATQILVTEKQNYAAQVQRDEALSVAQIEFGSDSMAGKNQNCHWVNNFFTRRLVCPSPKPAVTMPPNYR